MSNEHDATTTGDGREMENGKPEIRPDQQWINLNNEYLLPRSFLENCIVYIQRSGSTLVIRTIEEHSDLTIVLSDETAAIKALNGIYVLFNRQSISSNIDFTVN